MYLIKVVENSKDENVSYTSYFGKNYSMILEEELETMKELFFETLEEASALICRVENDYLKGVENKWWNNSVKIVEM